MTIRILITGGTFDKEYDELTGELIFKRTHLREMLKKGRCKLDIELKNVMMIDSLNINVSNMKRILKYCNEFKETRIIIIHGTDKMVDTAKYLGKNIKNKTIVLTGAIIPYAFGNSDGLFNLGAALAFVQTLPPGVYISMNGKYFNWNNSRKNKQTCEFEEK
jgi:L-asparaginase